MKFNLFQITLINLIIGIFALQSCKKDFTRPLKTQRITF